MLGSNTVINSVIREGQDEENQKHDVLIKYYCDNQWNVYSSESSTKIDPEQLVFDEVNPETCERIYPLPKFTDELIAQHRKEYNHKRDYQYYEDDVVWTRVRFTLFSLMVSGSIFASFNITTFYTTVVLVLGSQIRPVFLFGSWIGFIYEIT